MMKLIKGDNECDREIYLMAKRVVILTVAKEKSFEPILIIIIIISPLILTNYTRDIAKYD